jgi:hypothetical protein
MSNFTFPVTTAAGAPSAASRAASASVWAATPESAAIIDA